MKLCMFRNEKWGGHRINNHRANLFKQTINNCNLLDFGFNGPKFTWKNKRKNNPIMERLDRGFGNGEWGMGNGLMRSRTLVFGT